MQFYLFLFLIILLGGTSLIINNKFLLSVIIALEFLLLNTLTITIYTALIATNNNIMHVSIFILALSAVEASIGVSLVSLLSRSLNEVSLSNLNNLKE